MRATAINAGNGATAMVTRNLTVIGQNRGRFPYVVAKGQVQAVLESHARALCT